VISGVQSCYCRSTLPWAILGSSEITQVYMIGQLSPEIPFRLRKGPPGSPLRHPTRAVARLIGPDVKRSE
jgi:hypothetical protein